MGLRERLAGQRVYIDANVVIYLVQDFAELREAIDEFAALLADRELSAVTSELTLMETLVRPLRRADADEIEAYKGLLQRSGAFELVPVSSSILMEAARLRAELNLKTADAIHAASAASSGCSILLSNDRGLKVPPPLQLVRFA